MTQQENHTRSKADRESAFLPNLRFSRIRYRWLGQGSGYPSANFRWNPAGSPQALVIREEAEEDSSSDRHQ